MTIEELQQLLDALFAAYATGTKRVKFREREVEYQSLKDMKFVIDDLRRQISGRSSVSVAGFARGDS